MQREYDFDIRLNKFGEPDVDYYIAEAHKMRRQAIVAGFGIFRAWLKKTLGRAWFRDPVQSASPRRVGRSDWPWVDLILQSHTRKKAGHV